MPIRIEINLPKKFWAEVCYFHQVINDTLSSLCTVEIQEKCDDCVQLLWKKRIVMWLWIKIDCEKNDCEKKWLWKKL